MEYNLTRNPVLKIKIFNTFIELTTEDIKKKYDITEDLTPELEDEIKKEYKAVFKDLIPENQTA